MAAAAGTPAYDEFQFPSNGKAYPKRSVALLQLTKMFSSKVSIPFKRESVSKGRKRWSLSASMLSFNSLQTGKRIQRRLWRLLRHRNYFGFNSLQTGKRIQRCERGMIVFYAAMMFQFPSNGKAYPKVLFPEIPFDLDYRFNSLQTESVSKG